MAATTVPLTTSRSLRSATWRNLGLTYLLGVALMVVQATAYALRSDETFGPGAVLFPAVGGLVVSLLAAGALLVTHRGRDAAVPARVGIVLGALGIVAFPVTYYLPLSVIFGGTAYLLSRDAAPGRAASAARVLGVVSVMLTVVLIVARFAGFEFQVGG